MRIQEFDRGDFVPVYDVPHDHRIYGRGHGLRVEVSKTLVRSESKTHGWKTAADLSCGNGAIARAAVPWPTLGDVAPGYDICGPLEETLDQLGLVDAYICSETLEHLKDPNDALLKIRDHAKWLFLSTPINAWGDTNGEHYWAWDREAIENKLVLTGFEPVVFASVDTRMFGESYLYGMWIAR